LTALIAVASAQYQVGYQAASDYSPSGYKPAAYKPAPYAANYEGPSDYSFNYEVNDPTTYDVKSQSEYSKDGYTAGSYSLIDADGLRRTVDYTADDYNGFQATVRREQTGYGYGQNYNGYSTYKPATYPAAYPASYPTPSYTAKY
jgi:Insect cuticle protein